MTTTERSLSAVHRASLVEASAISDDVVGVRGYETVFSAARLKRLGFSVRQAIVPALLIPIWDCSGDVVTYQLRPDEPRISDGKPVKYETMSGSRMALDVHPSVKHLVGDPNSPLFVTEGVKKGDALASRGCCAIALLGVWNWRGTNDEGGKTALADWEHVALNGRPVHIVFDSDVITNAAVHSALVRLAALLRARGASVMFVYLPSGAGGAKVGVDDFLAAGASVDDVIALATPELRHPPKGASDELPYRESDDGIVWQKPTRDGALATQLTNFTARIISDITEDDGVEERRVLEIEGRHRGRVKRFGIASSQYGGMTWATENLGASAACFPGTNTKDHARFAIQLLSGEIAERRIFAHTGWRKLGEQWVFLHGRGAITADGERSDVEVKLTGSLARIVLRAPPSNPGEAIRASLTLLELAPMTVMAPLVGCTYLAPLREFLAEAAPDFVVWFYGRTGAFKSEMVALAQSHFGEFDRLSLPASFSDTANAIERTLFGAKDCLVVVDDFHPASDRREEQTMAANASRLLRGVGNGSARQRMRADTTLRPTLRPRAIAMATGERLPAGHSAGSRMFPVPVVPGDVDVERLTAAQEQRGQYPAAMAAYIQWVAGEFENLSGTLPLRFAELRNSAQRELSGHSREPGQAAHLQLALETLLRFAVDRDVISRTDADARLAASWQALIEQSQERSAQLAAESSVHLFLSLLSDGFASRRAYVESLHGGLPAQPADWGWEETQTVDRLGAVDIEHRHAPMAAFLGCVDEAWLYLIPEATMQFIVGAAKGGDRHFPADQKTLLRDLHEAGLIATEEGGKRRIVKQRIHGPSQRVIKLKRRALQDLYPAGSREQREQREHGADPDSGSDAERSRRMPLDGNTTREQSDSNQATVPAVPAVPAVEDVREDWETLRV